MGDTMPPQIIYSDQKKSWIEPPLKLHVLEIVKKMPGRHKFVKGRCYFESDRANLEFMESSLEIEWKGPASKQVGGFKLLRDMERKARETRHEAAPMLEIPSKTKPYSHQNKALSLARGKLAFGYFMEQGTGKTKVVLDDASDLHLNGGVNGRIDTLIVIAPNGVHSQWVNEQLPKHLTPVIEYRAAYTGAALTPEEQQNMSKALKFKGGLRIICIHINSMSSTKGKEFLREVLLGGNCMLVVDESSRIKDLNSKRTKSICDLGRLAKYRRIMTGTPISQGAEDLYSQFYFLNPDILGHGSFYSFKNHFCRMGGFQSKKIVGYINEQELMDKIDAHTYRVLKEDCLDLPERNYIKVLVPMTPEQAKVYREIKTQFFTELEAGQILTAQMAVTRIARLQQIVNGFIWRNEKKDKHTGIVVEPFLYQEYPQNRVEATLNIIRESNPNSKVIVWIKFQGDFKLMREALEKEGIGYVDYVGSTPNDVREKHINKFRNDPSCKVFLSTPKSGGIGLDLWCASEVIWFSRDFSLENELQANDRAHRIGQTKVVNYHYLVSPGTVDEKIDEILRRKQNVADNFIDLRDMFV